MTRQMSVKQMTDQESIDAQQQNKQQQVQQHLIEAFATEIEMNKPHDVPYEVMSLPNMETNNEMENPLFAFKAKTDPDTMYLHEAMCQPNQKEFIYAMDKEL